MMAHGQRGGSSITTRLLNAGSKEGLSAHLIVVIKDGDMPKQIIIYLKDDTDRLLDILETAGYIKNRSDFFREALTALADEKEVKAALTLRLEELREDVRRIEKLQASMSIEVDRSESARETIVKGYCERREQSDKDNWDEPEDVMIAKGKRACEGYLTAPAIRKIARAAFPRMKHDKIVEELEREYQARKCKQ